ncbi:sphingomyelin phosphodiesterase 3, neutral membrane (neutral sphingomyelinase II) [Perkinsus chesapeaki]|uniref:Sphingomyelin phosphodiesterase 3, neutral membrane (Neutral sphingomyelinase II) n=1 Tax=Perkinsus chesapeaki TaxID=330153 RepID=A0A7J6M2C0_PERCH|nr:sphingomyelin phosphodiesterase 3, neutral membrane (neutral sphingomyelinase II) [Perkinsus chesapeaki]
MSTTSQQPSGGGVPPTLANLGDTRKQDDVINIMTFNTWLIPVRARFPGCLDPRIPERAQRVCRHIEQQANTYNLDVITLQEAWTDQQSAVASMINALFCGRFFARGEVVRYVQNRHGARWGLSRLMVEAAAALLYFVLHMNLNTQLKYSTKAFGTHVCECSAPTKFLDSGLIIMSRWPILMEKFNRFTVATGEDAMASKGALGVVLDRGSDVVIVATTHLDAGHDSDVKLAQLKVVLDVVAYLEKECANKGLRVAAAVMTGDWNIDGTGRDKMMEEGKRNKSSIRCPPSPTRTGRSTSLSSEETESLITNKPTSVYERVKDFLGNAGFQDVWQLHADKERLPHPPSYQGNWGEMSDETLAKYGVTSDQDVPSCPKRLDYLWVKSGAVSPVSCGGSQGVTGNRPAADSNLSSTSASSSSSSSHEVMMVTVAPAQMWRADLPLRNACARAMLSGDKQEEKGLRKQINSHNTNRTSDHASLVGRIRLLSSADLAPTTPNQRGKDELREASQVEGSAEFADVDNNEIIV